MSHYVGQVGPKFMGSNDSHTSASKVVRTYKYASLHPDLILVITVNLTE